MNPVDDTKLKTINEIFAEHDARVAAQRNRGSKLHDHLETIVILINGDETRRGVDLKGIISYVERNGIVTKSGKPLAESFIRNFCALNMFKWDQKHGTSDAVKANRTMSLRGADKTTNERIARWEAKAAEKARGTKAARSPAHEAEQKNEAKAGAGAKPAMKSPFADSGEFKVKAMPKLKSPFGESEIANVADTLANSEAANQYAQEELKEQERLNELAAFAKANGMS